MTNKQAQEFYNSLPPEQKELIDNLRSIKYRVNNLYVIKDKWNNEVVMKYNYAQRKLASYKHPRQITLKSRQQGISTKKLARNLDRCMFIPGYEAGIQSYGKNESKKLATRAKLMWDRFPEVIKQFLGLSIIKMNSDEIVFSNGSILKIGNFRGDTLQSLHVSELGKIARKYPEKAEELKAGAFQAVAQGNIISIESTAEGKSGLFYTMWQTAVNNLRAGRKLTPLDFQPVFLSWVEDPDCRLKVEYKEDGTPDVEIPSELEEYFKEVESKLHELEIFGCNIKTLDLEQKWWYTKKKEELGFKIKQEYPTFPEEAFEQSTEGTIYKDEYEKLIKEKRLRHNLAIKNYPTKVSYDLGMNDTTDLIFTQVYKGRPRIIYHYQNSGQPISFYSEIMHEIKRELELGDISLILPHDANVREMQTGRTRIEEFRRLGWKAIVQPKQSILDGIEATRQFLRVCLIDDSTCSELVDSIQMYRWKSDKRLQIFLQIPEHDEASNPCDSLRYTALGIHYNKTIPYNEKELEGNFEKTTDFTRNRHSQDSYGYEGFAV